MTQINNEQYFDTLKENVLNQDSNLQSAMNKAYEQFKTLGIPTKKHEDWKYTNISHFLTEKLTLAQKSNSTLSSNYPFEYKIVFQNGIFNEEKSSLPNGVSLSTNLESTQGIESNLNDHLDLMNLSALQSIIKISVDKNINVNSPIAIIHLSDNGSSKSLEASRIIINAQKLSKVNFLEIFNTTEDSQAIQTSVTKLFLEQAAIVNHIKCNLINKNSMHLGKVYSKVSRDATLNTFTFTVGGGLSRNNIEVDLEEENATSNVHGLFALKENDHCDNFSTIRHNAARTYSNQLFKGILDNDSHGIFTGKIVVQRDSQEVDSTQLNKNLLLSKKAHIDTRPQLEVYADDVKCAHGATIGQISQEEAFYLQSRGISLDRARVILAHAFSMEALEKIENEQIREYLTNLLFEKFETKALGI